MISMYNFIPPIKVLRPSSHPIHKEAWWERIGRGLERESLNL